jgi:alpha-tubulin suppressor-like RCC1 family protein
LCTFNIVIKNVACGETHALLLSDPGYVYSMGCNKKGQLGLGSNIAYADQPSLIAHLEKIPIRSLECGSEHSAAISLNGELFTWGSNEEGQLGYPSQALHVNAPGIVKLGHGTKKHAAVTVSCGNQHTGVITRII